MDSHINTEQEQNQWKEKEKTHMSDTMMMQGDCGRIDIGRTMADGGFRW